MYKNFYFDRTTNTCHLWTDEPGKEYQTFPHSRYAYIVDPNGEHTILTGLKVKKVKSWDRTSEKSGMIFEHDIPVATRVLVDRYFDSDEPSTGHNVMFFDIEVEKGLKYSKPKRALNRVTSIAYYVNGQYTCLLLDEIGKLRDSVKTVKITDTDKTIDVNLKVYPTEADLLIAFLEAFKALKISILTSWNGDIFDCPYIYNRMCNVIGQDLADTMSPIQKVELKDISGGKNITVKFAGVSQMEYLQLYKKFTYNEESSYKLENISQKELKRGKLKYEGTLDDLYNNDIEAFIEYNVNDVELLVALDKKTNLIETARGICHAGHVPYDDFLFSSRYLEGAALTYCKVNKLIATRTGDEGNSGMAAGAAVKVPKPGLFRLIIDCDLTSLYPSLIRTLNISPETMYGKVLNWDEGAWKDKTTPQYTIAPHNTLQDELMGTVSDRFVIDRDDFWKYLTDNQLCIASNGVLFRKDKPGLLPSILTQWFNERKRLSKLAEEYGKAGDVEKYRYYDQKQLIQKILLNSFYGVLLLPSFRFYDKNLGEAITLTGQSVIKFSMLAANYYCNRHIATQNVDYVLSSDTDSLFLSVEKLINPDGESLALDVEVERTLEFTKHLQDALNNAYNQYALQFHNVEEHYLHIKQEMIAEVGFFGQAKKRYALKVINKKGVPVQEVDIKGLDVVRSSFPPAFRKFMKKVVHDILDMKKPSSMIGDIRRFKSDFMSTAVSDIMLPTSVKELSKYKPGQKSTPIYYKAAQNYNMLLNLFNIESLPPIEDEDKIIYAYMKQNPYGFEVMALKGQGDDPPELQEFVEKFIDRNKIFETTLITKLDTIWTDLGWGKVQLQEDCGYF